MLPERDDDFVERRHGDLHRNEGVLPHRRSRVPRRHAGARPPAHDALCGASPGRARSSRRSCSLSVRWLRAGWGGSRSGTLHARLPGSTTRSSGRTSRDGDGRGVAGGGAVDGGDHHALHQRRGDAPSGPTSRRRAFFRHRAGLPPRPVVLLDRRPPAPGPELAAAREAGPPALGAVSPIAARAMGGPARTSTGSVGGRLAGACTRRGGTAAHRGAPRRGSVVVALGKGRRRQESRRQSPTSISGYSFAISRRRSGTGRRSAS